MSVALRTVLHMNARQKFLVVITSDAKVGNRTYPRPGTANLQSYN